MTGYVGAAFRQIAGSDEAYRRPGISRRELWMAARVAPEPRKVQAERRPLFVGRWKDTSMTLPCPIPGPLQSLYDVGGMCLDC